MNSTTLLPNLFSNSAAATNCSGVASDEVASASMRAFRLSVSVGMCLFLWSEWGVDKLCRRPTTLRFFYAAPFAQVGTSATNTVPPAGSEICALTFFFAFFALTRLGYDV
jgi:hypothetical protein